MKKSSAILLTISNLPQCVRCTHWTGSGESRVMELILTFGGTAARQKARTYWTSLYSTRSLGSHVQCERLGESEGESTLIFKMGLGVQFWSNSPPPQPLPCFGSWFWASFLWVWRFFCFGFFLRAGRGRLGGVAVGVFFVCFLTFAHLQELFW